MKKTLYEVLISLGYSKDVAFELQNKYIFGGSVTREEKKIFDDYDSMRKGVKP